MATIIIENVPEIMVKEIGRKINFDQVNISKKRPKKDITIGIQKMIDDKNNTSMEVLSAQDFLKEIKKW